ncbi:MAG: Nucleoid-associated protein YbaB [Alphaproteobacteria bacterium MarineAlpha3_Bin5]|nr:YbaB/EbfC family nucleoid-associated protein [Magnetovibrio sp.]PPR76171.1 MAG: Nucleoid-associated protein YbaB [Alphaproteobacteria bacterium MarineAlpha3_Bin5]|tara:strand:+ start:550 stop:873 length:324 start_codon:yes stop_codon:yes gene_type:complete
MTDLGQIFKQAQNLQGMMQKLQKELSRITVTGESAGGMCEVTLNGKGEANSVKVDPSLLSSGDSKMLEDLLVTAFNKAKAKVDEEKRDKLSKLTGGFPVPPGIQLPF